MTVKTRDQLKSDMDDVANLPDNITGLITPADLRGQLGDIIDSAVFPEDGEGSGTTVDTGETYRIIMLSDGTVRAIPFDAVAPSTPTGFAGITRLTSVSLTWTAVAEAVSYLIVRNGTNIATTSFTSYRDAAITIGQTYTYTVASIDQYQQRSPASSPVTAFIDPALNQTPTDVTITVWPTPIPVDGYSYVRVNARELDVQDIAFELEVDAGSLTSTPDPSTWKIRI
jgi:hypothetical protein